MSVLIPLFGLGPSPGWIKCSQVPELMPNRFPTWGPLLHISLLGQGTRVGLSSIAGRGQSPPGYALRWKKCDKHMQRVNVCGNVCCLEAHHENTALPSRSQALTSAARSLGHKSLLNSICLFSFAFSSHFYFDCTDTNPFVFHVFTSGILFKAFIRCFLFLVSLGGFRLQQLRWCCSSITSCWGLHSVAFMQKILYFHCNDVHLRPIDENK